ncbi:MAG TPA: SRPBCC family protein [Jiangellaceae bacterium]
MRIEVSTTIDRPVAEVWRWYAVEHVRNHPRWDPDMELEQVSEGPIGLGTKIRRRNVRWGEPIEGEMEIVEWEPERAMATRVRDADMEMAGRVTFQKTGPDRTVLAIAADVPGLDESKAGHLSGMMQRSVENVKRLAESDL